MDAQDWSRKRVLVTGAGGFLGGALARTLAEQGAAELTLLGRQGGHLPSGLPQARLVQLDLLERDRVLSFFAEQDFDVVFHLAGKVDQSIRPEVYAEQFRVHVETLVPLTDALCARPHTRLVHVGSNAEYGLCECPHSVTTRENPVTAYGCSKLAGSRLVLARAQSEGLAATVARPFLVYGRGQSSSSLLQGALAAARQGRAFSVTGGEQSRDFVAVDKFCADLMAVACLPADEAVGRIFNICTGVEITVRETLAMVQEVFPAFKPQFAAAPYRKAEIMHSAGVPFRGLSAEQARQALLSYLRAEYESVAEGAER